MDNELLNEVFRFKHKAPSDRQDASVCVALISHFSAFVETLEAVEVEGFLCGRSDPLADDRVVPASSFASHELDALQEVCRRLSTPETGRHKRGDVWYHPWLPAYGCAVQRTQLNATEMKLDVIFVDGWERTLHFVRDGPCIHSSVPTTYRILHCGNVKTTVAANFDKSFESVLEKAQQTKTSERSAADNALGHQKTPQFIAAVIRRAMAKLNGESSSAVPQGGTTDVGQHTGGRRRDTCWPLVRAAIEHNLCCGKGLFLKTMVMFELSLLQTAVQKPKLYRDFLQGGRLEGGAHSCDDHREEERGLVPLQWPSHSGIKTCMQMRRQDSCRLRYDDYLKRTKPAPAAAMQLAPVSSATTSERGVFRFGEIQPSAFDATSTDFGTDLKRYRINVKDECDRVDDQFAMLQIVIQNVVELLECGYDVSVLQNQCALMRFRIDGFVDELNLGVAKRYKLPNSKMLQQLSNLRCEVELESPDHENNLRSGESCDSRRRRALNNLAGTQYIDGATCSLGKLIRWEQSSDAPDAYRSVMVLRTFEAFMFVNALNLNGNGTLLLERTQTKTDLFMERLQYIVTRYQQVANECHQRPHMTSMLDVEQRSRELLIIWIAFCLVHQRYVDEEPLCAQYKIALDWKDLKVAVLSDRAAIDALENVAKYIRAWNNCTEGPPLFHLSDQSPTFDFAREYGLKSTSMNAMYDRESKAWEAHVQSKWDQILQKQEEAKNLRAGISHEKECRRSTQRDLDAEQERLNLKFPHVYNHGSRLRTQLRQALQQINENIDWRRTALSNTLIVPAYPVRSLPPSKEDAIKIIFMLNMPRNLEILGNLCLTAQRALAPTEPTSGMTTLPDLSPMTWEEYYSQHTQSGAFPTSSKVFTVSPSPFIIPRSHGASSVDTLCNRSQYAEECIWNPTLTGSAMMWMDTSGKKVNPFEASQVSILDNFIEKLPSTWKQFQWMNAWPGEGDTRGNNVYANLCQKPEDFEVTSFISLGSLRAFPNQQIRKLQCALLEDNLPWSSPFVKVIVLQSLYQVGNLTDEAVPKLLWKMDMIQNMNGLTSFCVMLKDVADKLEQTPRRFESVPLLSELAGYLHQFTKHALPIVKTFARMTRRWAENEITARQKYAGNYSTRRIAESRQKECILFGYALLAYTMGPWDDDAIQDVCELNVLFRNSFYCASVNMPSTEQMLQVESRIAEVMTRRISEVIDYVENIGADEVLTGLVRLVSETSPMELTWKRFQEILLDDGQFGSCYEAHDEATDIHYSINVFTGSVLTNGYSPGGLPSTIRDHKVFKTLFQLCNFEVFIRNGMLRTERKYYDRLYDFAHLPDGDLFIQELSTDKVGTITSTLQLCPPSWIEKFSRMFPSRLVELHSHWYWAERKCVLFRPKAANEREVYFVAIFDEEYVLNCYKVPLNDSKCAYDEILDRIPRYDRFMKSDKTLLSIQSVLKKFENEQFHHPLMTCDGVIKIELPRFKLTFLLNDRMQFESVEHKGYMLAAAQQFDDFLPRFHRYLILELQDEANTSRPDVRMLLPVGSVVKSVKGIIDVEIPIQPDSHVNIACYNHHRRMKVFQTESISARLELAAVYACAGTNVPSKRLKMTGAEASLQMLRACRSGRPYSVLERGFLLTIRKLAYPEPAVKLLVEMLLSEADRLAFLFGQSDGIEMCPTVLDEKTEYADMCVGRIQRNPLRSQLRECEEKLIFGQIQHSPVIISADEMTQFDPTPVRDDYVKTIERELCYFVRHTTSTENITPQLPLQSNIDNAMSKAMLDELQLSWNCHHSQAQVRLKVSSNELVEPFEALRGDVLSKRAQMEKYLWDYFMKATSNKRDRLLALANFTPNLTMNDIVRCAFDTETLHVMVPLLSAKAREQFRRYALQFMELCVLEDKMDRVVGILKRKAGLSEDQLITELMNVRQWQSTDFPYWLSFEVEGRLQIRHEQFVVAKHLIDQPGTVCQLNMGSGKTRVILPMLFLHFTQSRNSRVVRAHFLSSLLSEAQQYMHRHLLASNARLGVFEQPFHRQIDLDMEKLEVIRDRQEELALYSGIQIVSPEHRMSLELKRLELDCEDPCVEILDEILDGDQFLDVLDECDAILHHRYHLVYAVGDPSDLYSGIERWKMAEALLRVVTGKFPSSRVSRVLQAPHVSCISPDYAKRLGAFEGTRLNAVVDSTELLREHLKKALLLDLIDNAPFELMWLNTFGATTAREPLVRAITDSSVSLQAALGDYNHKFSPYTSQLLALRGLVAFGVLEHCLEKRYRVDFGLPVPGTRQKKIAIPFRAADVPSERSEFSHPDVCIVLTLLGYYHGGLTEDEIRTAFRLLLRLDTSEQHQQYDQWYKSVEPGLSEEEGKTLCDVRHISLADARQLETLCRVYKFCMETINFFLNTCVFPTDTQLYPQRLSRTAWNLAAGNNSIGFSGTNDNHRLLPLSVKQHEPDEPSLLGTNGKMIDKIVRVTHDYKVVPQISISTAIPWQNVLLFALSKGAQALIDTGALLAGVMNHDVAKFLLQQPNFKFAGLTYFDSRRDYNCWMIAEKDRHHVMPLKNASMLEKETFVIFDEARSRGSDMKLPHNASAVLTLGPKLTKDKLMQGAGRMRQLGCNQTLWIASFDEVAQSILQTSEHSEVSALTAIDVLNWVVDNTKTESVRGLLEWASSGIHYRKTQLDRGAELVDEDWSLETLYQEKMTTDKIARIIQAQARCGFEGVDDVIVAQVCRRAWAYGLDDEMCVTAHTDECERELQVEEEVQQVQELEIAQHTPAMERTWKYADILQIRSIRELEGLVQVFDMQSYTSLLTSSKELSNLAWFSAQIFVTDNFASTILTRTGITCVNEFIRVCDTILVFNNGQVLLVSECEADHILELLWSTRGDSTACDFRFMNLAFACEAIDRVGLRATFQDVHMTLGCRLDGNLSMLSTIACHLYNGQTMITKHPEQAVELAFRELLRRLAQRETTLSNFVKSRGNSHKWTPKKYK
ncbi:Hypothetical protein PHPALM_14391 [Phytophthora palmivora]|uniref:ubiquitinyl hydrolase 1 n=1 Tax=Phytophthora palmivora TaxID=4796 RepID=A0A2P4XUT2_9STRA|nr:Hypothetical protein PHPALM_14391 [Phytophthora palmivora]